MKTKATKFSKKLLALFLAVLMAMSCFTGALTAFASSKDDYHDLNVTANFLNWAELTDDDTAEALLDWADSILRGVNLPLNLDIKIAKIQGTIDSVDGLLDIIRQASDLIEQYKKTLGGDIKNINLTAINDLKTNSDTLAASGVGYRSCNDAKDIVLTVAKLLNMNSNDVAGKNIIRQFLIGEFNIGTLLKGVLPMIIGTSDIYQLIGDLLDLPSGYKSNMVYNIVQTLILNAFYKDSNSQAYIDAKAKKLDTLMFDLLSAELLNKISVLVTYGLEVEGVDGKMTTDNSAHRYKEIMAHVKSCGACGNYAQAAAHLGYDPNLIYSEEPQFKDNILLLAYGAPDANGHATADTQLINIDETDNLFDFALEALKMAWQTVLKDTLGLVHVNYATDRGHGSNFDNVYYYWARENLAGGWNENNLAAMYSMDNLMAWANSTTVGDLTYKDGQWVDKLGNAYTNTTNKTEKISDDKIINVTDEDGRVVQQASMTLFNDYGAASAEEFLDWVKDTLTYDREVAADATGTWRDIDATQLFGKLRYSPLADYGFNMQTGPINLYLMQTGETEINNFFDNLINNNSHSSMVAGFNDCLVSAVYDLFPQKDNINGTRPTLATTGNTTDAGTIATTLVENAALVFQYAADAADKNILNAFYNDPSINGGSTQISEKNLEAAAMPLLIACIREVDMLDPIHDGEWDACKDAEGIAYLALTEYLSYVLPDNDYSIEKNADGKYDIDFNATILPMVRDALGYILQSLTPIVDENGNESFNAYHPEKYTDVTIWNVLNDIICYMADDMGIAAVLGIFDANGKCAITRDNTIWQNIDLVVNKYLPVLGELQYGDAGKSGAASSEDLIWNDIVQGVLNIGNTNANTGYCGITNFMYRLFTFVSAPPISSTPVVQTVYSLVEKLLNAIFGARYSGQRYTKIVPALEDLNSLGYSTNAPFDAVIQKSVICYWDTTNATGGDGFIGSLITNLYEFFGGNGYATNSAADQVKSTWKGAMFAVRSVNSFIPSFVPQVGSHTLGSLQAIVKDASVQRNAGSVYESTIKVTNTSTGVNRFYNDVNGKQLEQGRYYMEVTDITTDNSAYTVTYTKNQFLAPEETAVYSVKCNSTANADTTVGITIKYNVYQSTVDRDTGVVNTRANLLNTTELTTTTYLYVTPEAGWFENCYTVSQATLGGDNETMGFGTSNEPDAGKSSTYTQATSTGATKDRLYVTAPKDMVLSSNNINSIEQMGVRVRNTSGKYAGGDHSIDGVYVYPSTDIKAYAVNGTTVSDTLTDISGTGYAYCAINVENGDILNYNLFDYSLDDGQTWNRGTKQTSYRDIYSGYTQDEIDAIEAAQGPDSLFVTRTHVAYTFEEACTQGLINAVQRTKTADGYTYQAVFFNTNKSSDITTQMLEGNFSDNGKHSISFSTPTNGIYLKMAKVKQNRNSSTYRTFLGYDGTTKLTTEKYTMTVNFYNSVKSMVSTINMYIVDTSDSATLDSTYQHYNNWLAGYQATDFTNPDAYADLQAALKDALSARSKPVNSNTAGQFSSKMERVAKTEKTTSIFGDEAYVPVTEAQYSTLPASIAAYTYKANGYLYWNSTCTQPVYTRTAIADSNVTGTTTETINGKTYTVGKIAGVVDVIKNPSDNVWYLKNAVAYEYDWDTTTYDGIPYYGVTNVQEKDKDGNLLYLKDQFAYRTAAGVKTTSKDTVSPWAYKVAELTDRIIPNTPGTENRGLYQRAIDELKYYGEVAEKAISAESLPTARNEVSDLRKGMNNVNFEVVTYEQMVKAAKEVESMYSYDAFKDYYRAKDVTYDADGNPVIAAGATVIFSCLDSKYDETFKAFVENGGYRQIKLVGIEDRSKTVYNTSKSALAVSNAIDTFNLYYKGIQSRGYIGNKIIEEIPCAIGDSFDKFTVTQAPVYGEDEDGNTIVTTPAVISVADGANIVRGAVEDGVLVNKGEKVYTEESWTMFVARLADAITNCKDADDTISKTYTIKSDLKIAENKLALAAGEPAADTYNVSASLVVATNNKGATNGVKVCGDYTVTVYNDANEVVAETTFTSSLENNTFNLQLPDGTYKATITSQYSMERDDITIIVNGADVAGPAIPIVACNFDGNTNISPADAIAIYNAKSLTDSNAYLNLDGNSSISPADAVIVYGCSNGAISLEPVVIQ